MGIRGGLGCRAEPAAARGDAGAGGAVVGGSAGRTPGASPLCPRAAVAVLGPAGLGSGRGRSRRARAMRGHRRAGSHFGLAFFISPLFPFLVLPWAAWSRWGQRTAGSRQK